MPGPGSGTTSGKGAGAAKAPGPVDFSALILGFSSAALYYLGEKVVDGKAPGEQNLMLARQNVDIIALLKDKTRGNLAAEEDRLIAQVLADLQLKLVDAAKPPGARS